MLGVGDGRAACVDEVVFCIPTFVDLLPTRGVEGILEVEEAPPFDADGCDAWGTDDVGFCVLGFGLVDLIVNDAAVAAPICVDDCGPGATGSAIVTSRLNGATGCWAMVVADGCCDGAALDQKGCETGAS